MPREVFCDLCGGKFFPHSLPHHRKSCQKKVQAQMIECPYCNMGVTQLEMDAHVACCKAAKAAGAKPTGQSAQLRQRLLSDGPRASISKERRGTATTASGRLISQTGSQGAPGRETPPQSQEKKIPGTGATAYSGTSPEAAVLVPCQVCGRTFNMDRIAKHQAVCLKLRKKRPVFQAQKQRLFMEGGSTGTVVGSAVAAPRKARRPGAPQTQPLNSHWREESKSFRQAIRAARGAPPMPRWGGGFGDARRGAPTASRSAPKSQEKSRSISNRGGSSRSDYPIMKLPRGSSKTEGASYGSGEVRGSLGGSAMGVGMSKAAKQHAAAWEGVDPFAGARNGASFTSNVPSASNPLAAFANGGRSHW